MAGWMGVLQYPQFFLEKRGDKKEKKNYDETITTVNVLNFLMLYSIFGLNFVFYAFFFFCKILNGMANNVDPDQTALFACTILLETLVYEILGHLP